MKRTEIPNFRIIKTKEGEYLFSIRDICNCLNISNPNRFLDRLGITQRIYRPLKTNGGMQNVRFLTKAEVVLVLDKIQGRLKYAESLRTTFEDIIFPALEIDSEDPPFFSGCGIFSVLANTFLNGISRSKRTK